MRRFNADTFWALTSLAIQGMMYLFVGGIVIGIAGLLKDAYCHTVGWELLPGQISAASILLAILATAAAVFVFYVAIILLALVVAGIQYLIEIAVARPRT